MVHTYIQISIIVNQRKFGIFTVMCHVGPNQRKEQEGCGGSIEGVRRGMEECTEGT